MGACLGVLVGIDILELKVLNHRISRGLVLLRTRGQHLLEELEVLQLICEGKSNREIAAALDVSANTVAVHRANIMDRLGVHKAAELVVYAIQHGLVTLP